MSDARRARASRSATKSPARPRTRHVLRRYLIASVVVLIAAGVTVAALRQNLPTDQGTVGGQYQQIGRIQAADYHSLAFSPDDPNTLFFGHHNGIMQSRDGGRSWEPVVNRPSFDAMSLAANSSAPNVFWTAGHNLLNKSSDGAKTWEEIDAGLPGFDIHAFTVSASDPNTLYAFVVGFGLFKSRDGGGTWQPLGRGAPQEPFALATGGTPEALYAGTDQGVMISRDGGASFSQPIGVGGLRTLALAASPTSNVVHAGTPSGLFRSVDGGMSWSKTSYTGDVMALAVYPSNPQRVALVDRQGRVFATS